MEDLLIKTLPVGQLQTNCYLVIDRSKNEALIIDPGDSADYIIRILTDEKVKPSKIVATHGHFDHILAVYELKLAYNISFLISKKDLFLVSAMQKNASHFLGVKVDPPPEVDKYLFEDEKVKVGRYTFSVIETPGHTPGSICLYLKDKNALFTGDTIFAGGGLGRTDFSYSSKKDLYQSIKKIFQLPNKTTIYPGHGPKSLLSQEKHFHTLASRG